jgi:hypothetical protein
MRTAYILIQRNDVIDPLAPALRAIPGVLVADDVLGPYDAIVLAQHEPLERPVSDVLEEILRLPGVTRALVASVVSQVLSLVDNPDLSAATA